ncbi:DUF4133 domain-containing protein [Pedobacter psychroterrae]|uniref:DUF4133 domain-containing protein n=1 Tax=Pedobacter psychroterrae TaxID=2530453 RepID=A0A4V2MLS0_9SPHI|nr:DUF4133 domain-containing protein [Pedobacter psychroterrae]TCD03167.1 DUF4133 domain-containing protein [Pedobacter psychroterrae]
MSSVYQINKGVGRAMEFRGLKAQYIGFLAGGLVGLLLLFAALYIAGVNLYWLIGLIGGLGFLLFTVVFRMSAKYGQHGLLKKLARRSIPTSLISRSRHLFTSLNSSV